MNFETMAFYLLSSLLQADAAIIGFGIVFVIYKLQSMENRYELALQILRASPNYYNGLVDLVKQIIENDEPEVKGSALRQHLNRPYYKELELLATVPIRVEQVKKEAYDTMWYISSHMFVCACSLVVVPILKNDSSDALVVLLSIGILIYFWLVIRKVRQNANDIISRQKEFDLSILSPKIYEEAHR